MRSLGIAINIIRELKLARVLKSKKPRKVNMPEEVNRFYLNIFINLLREHFSPYSYSIGKPQDSSVCLGTENGYWIVYGCNRIARMDEKRFMTVVEAAMEMLSRLCCNEEEEISVKSGFLMSIYQGDYR